MGAELASPVTILVREPGRVTAGGGEPLVRSRGVKELLQRVVHRAGHKRAQIHCLYLLRPAVAGVKRPILRQQKVPRNAGRVTVGGGEPLVRSMGAKGGHFQHMTRPDLRHESPV